MRPSFWPLTIMCCFLFLSSWSGTCRAESSDDAPVDSLAMQVAAVEMGIALYSYAAVEAPRTVGWFLVGTSPLYGGLKRHFSEEALNPGDYAYMGAHAAFGLYNIAELSKDSHSRSDRFWQNEVGWHLAFLALAVGTHASQKEKNEKSDVRTGIALREDGTPLFVMQYSF